VFKDKAGKVLLVLVIESKKGVTVTLTDNIGWPAKKSPPKK